MRLERVIARDSRRATEQVIEQFGADALVISNQKVNGMTEIVVAVDIDSTPLDASEPRETAAQAPAIVEQVTDEASFFQRGVTRTGERVEPILSDLHAATDAGTESVQTGYAATLSPPSFGSVLRHSLNTTPSATAVPASSSLANAVVSARTPVDLPAQGLPAWLKARTSPGVAEQLAPLTPIKEAPQTPAADTVDGVRARELVELVRDELASMRKEIALSRQMVVSAGIRRVGEDVQPVVEALEQAGVPLALRSLLIDQIVDSSDSRKAIQVIRKTLAASIRTLPDRGSLSGVHVIAGPSGCGKTHMVCRLANRHAAARGANSVAVMSFADQRIGAWTQMQMMASRSGIDCFRVSDTEVFQALLGELSQRELILVDTAANALPAGLESIQSCAPSAKFHLLLPADASSGAVRRQLAPKAWNWHSLMLSKMDESLQPWPVIQALCNQEFMLSVSSADPSTDSLPSEIEAGELIDHALAQSPELSALAAPEPLRTRKASARKPTRDLRNAA
jgi:flagellar biosynthesis GTPase FlhF